MNLRRLGNLVILATLLLVVVDWLLRLQSPPPSAQRGPEGFSWPTRGLGEVEIGIEGAFTIDLEESFEGEGGESTRVPEIRIEGQDPRPRDQGMSMQKAVITGFSAALDPQVIARAPRAWLALQQVEGATHFDRNQPWRLDSPVVDFPGLAGGQKFTLTADFALYDPTTNEIHCPEHFLLTSPTLEIDGFGLRLDPQRREVRFGERVGAVDWQMQLADGSLIRGYTDDGGSLLPVGDAMHRLRLDARQTCRTDLPASTGAGGRLETMGLEFLLEEVEGQWRPRSLSGTAPSSWAGQDLFLAGKSSYAVWQADALQSIQIDGPLFGHVVVPEQAWIGARGGAWIDTINQSLHLHRLVTIHRNDGVLHTSRAEVRADGSWSAGGGVHLSGPSGLAIADHAHAGDPEPGGARGLVAEGQVRFLPSAPELDLLTGPRILVDADGSAHLGPGFHAHGLHPEGRWDLEGEQVSTHRRGDRRLTLADGDVVWSRGELTLFGDSFEHDDLGQGSLRGSPASAIMKLPAGPAVARCSALIRSGERLISRSKAEFEVPAVTLGLSGERVRVQCDHLERTADGWWKARRNLRFDGALVGEAEALDWHPDHHAIIRTHAGDAPMTGTTLEGAWFRGLAREWKLEQNGVVDAEGELDLDYQPQGRDQPLHLIGEKGHLTETSGWVLGDVEITTAEIHATGRRADWQQQEDGWLVKMQGPSRFEHARGHGKAHHMEYRLGKMSTLRLFAGREQAYLSLADGREVHADWIEVDPERMTFSSRNGVVSQTTPHPTDFTDSDDGR